LLVCCPSFSSASGCVLQDVRSGDVLQKKNMWEIYGDPPGRTEPKPAPHGKKHTFIVTGHGKYEKISVDECGDLSQNAGRTFITNRTTQQT
uniref:Uncharacterized protein n=1 Tax=Xiphophorus couchianus TaxID=32473 RepID=A0A3B5L7F6_9TELE